MNRIKILAVLMVIALFTIVTIDDVYVSGFALLLSVAAYAFGLLYVSVRANEREKETINKVMSIIK